MKVLLWISALTWELPQTIVGFFVWLFACRTAPCACKVHKGVEDIYLWSSNSGLSLGRFRFINAYAGIDTASHECGHSVQSLILGPLYLLVIGLPSLLWAGFICKWSGKDYYWLYTEAWADKLGGVVRK